MLIFQGCCGFGSVTWSAYLTMYCWSRLWLSVRSHNCTNMSKSQYFSASAATHWCWPNSTATNHRQHNYIKHIVCSDLQLIWPHGQDHIKGTNYKTLTERCEQLRAFLRVLVLQRDVALLLCGAVERRQLSHVTAQQRVQQRHHLLAQHGAQLHVCVRIHRAQD